MNPIRIPLASLILTSVPALLPAQEENALKRSFRNVQTTVEMQVSASDHDTPLWLTANKYGLSSVDSQNGYLRTSVIRNADTDSLYRWRMGYGIDIAGAYGHEAHDFVQQLYADFDYWGLRLTIGAKQQPMAFKNQTLSSGSQTLGINARPVPGVRLEVPKYIGITGRKHHWAAIKGHISYGMMTDGGFQEDYVSGTHNHYAKKGLLHTKAGYLRLGNPAKFPITFEGGLEMATQFGGTVYNALTWDGETYEPIKMGQGIKDFVDATFGTGGDVSDGDGYANATGNTVGSWLFKLTYHGSDWKVSAYADHYFEDHSQMFLEYGWRDGLYGVEINLPANRFVNTIVYEYMKTTYQSGPLYHDHTEAVPDQISAVDNYYNHNLYAGWQHWGQAMGNPLFLSPLYNHTGNLAFTANRFKAHHIGLSGQPTHTLSYRLLFSHLRSLGTYSEPFINGRNLNSWLVECTYAPGQIGKWNASGWKVKLGFAGDRGSLATSKNTGAQFTLSYTL